VAKHGNRSVSSKSGKWRMFWKLWGVNIDLDPVQVKECIEKVGIGFIYAPVFHKSMKHAAGSQKGTGNKDNIQYTWPFDQPFQCKRAGAGSI